MANEADLLSAAASLRNAELIAGYTAYQLRQMWSGDLGMWGGRITEAVHEGVGNTIANVELLQQELADRAADCDAAAETARQYKQAMDNYRAALAVYNENVRLDPDGDHGWKPTSPDYGPWALWPYWVSE